MGVLSPKGPATLNLPTNPKQDEEQEENTEEKKMNPQRSKEGARPTNPKEEGVNHQPTSATD